MLTTLDSFSLRLPAPTLVRLVAGHSRLGLSDLIRPRVGSRAPAPAAGAIGRLVRQATYLGELRRPGVPGSLWLFGARSGGRSYSIIARPLGQGVGVIVAMRGGSPGNSAEWASAGQDAAITEIIRMLERARLTLYPVGSRIPRQPRHILKDHAQRTAADQTVARVDGHSGRTGAQPDIAYIDPVTNMRVNVEVDISLRNLWRAIRKYIYRDSAGVWRANDPRARYVFVQVDPNSSSGAVRRVIIYTPRPDGGGPQYPPRIFAGPLNPGDLLTRPSQTRAVLPVAR